VTSSKAGRISVLIAALRDLQWRRRRFIIAIIGTGVVFAMTLVLTGLSNGFTKEAQDTVDKAGVDAWIIPEGAAGPYLGASPFDESVTAEVAQIPGVDHAGPLVFSGTTTDDHGTVKNVNVFGAAERGPGMPAVSKGRVPHTADEVAVSSVLSQGIGDTVALGAAKLRVVGIVHNSTALAGTPNVFLTVEGAQKVSFAGQPVASSIGVIGHPQSAPPGFKVVSHNGAVDDVLRPMSSAHGAISFLAVLLWIVAALIVGSVIYLSALERVRDFAVFKAVGVSSRSVMSGLALQAVIVAIIAALVGALLSLVLGPLFPMRVVIPLSALALLPVIAIAVGLAASIAGLRRAVAVDPALAFGGP
jgi:putative ABC transport system permease protein